MSNCKVVFLCFMLILTFQLNAQIPLNDPNWVKNTSLSDSFNGSSINTTKWHVLDCTVDNFYEAWGDGTGFAAANTTVSGGYLNLRADTATINCLTASNMHYYHNDIQTKTGGIWSQSFGYSYGYVEVYAKLPGFVDGGGVAHGDKFWPAMWLCFDSVVYNPNQCSLIHDEIDMMDECCSEYYNAATIGSSLNKWNGACGYYTVGSTKLTSSTPLCTNFHKYAVEWNENRCVFYFDDVPYYQILSSTFTLRSMRLVLDLQILGTYFWDENPNEVAYPQYYSPTSFYPGAFTSGHNTSMIIDYVNYYQLNLDCGNSATMLTNTDVANFVPAVKSDITFGNGSNTISFGSSDVKYYRAVNSITIKGDWTVPVGAEIGLIPTICH